MSPHAGRGVPTSIPIAIFGAWLLFVVCESVGHAEAPGVQVIDGFTVDLYADDDLAHDIYSLTIDSLGRVVVSGQGYVRILKDTDADGIADQAIPYVDGPQTGAQGMFFVGRDLICSGDEGLIRYRDRDGDDQADGPPDVFLRIAAGNEHDLHAIRKGPDGWWYLIAGNSAGVDHRYVSLPTSPVKRPVAGTVLRLQPDLTKGEVYAHGFRNAYDFDFGPNGDLLAFDSDGEREISLPWYLPTRVFHVLSGSHQGWVTRSWKRPDYFFDAPPVVGEFGRSSPTGVVTYEHTQFPESFRGAVFVLDWTYGRVLALKLKQDEATWSSQWIEFMTATGQNGFAPTDAAVGPDGSLYVSIGGRGTRGGVYRIRAASLPGAPAPLPFRAVKSTNREDRLNFCLAAPQPLSSWSRLIWEPIAKELTSEPFILAALDAERPTRERIRAIEILTEKYQGVDSDMVQRLADDPDPMVRARAVWSVGRSHPEAPNLRNVRPFLEDDNPLVVRTALEALLGAQPEVLSELLEPLARQLAHPDRFLRQTALGLLPKVVDEDLRHLAELAFPQGWQASIPIAIEFARRQDGFTKYPVEIALSLLKSASSPTLRMEAVRLLQLGFGDLNSNEPDRDPVFDGYSAGHDLTDHQQEIREILQVLDEIYPSGATSLDRELERVMAMLAPDHGELFQQVVSRFTVDAHPVDDFHRLIVISRFRNSIAQEQRQLIAEAILHLERKLIARELRQDTSWNDRFVELYDRLVEQDSELPAILAMHPDFGDPGHVRLTKHIPSNLFDQVISRFAQRIRSDNDYEWSADVVYLLGESLKEDEKDLVRGQFEDYALRDSVIMSLANHPLEQDRRFFSAGLEAAPFEVLESCVNALGLLPPSEEATENVAMALALRRLGFEGKEAIARDQLAELLRRNLKEQHGYTLGRAGDPQRAAVNTWVASVQQRFPEEFARQSGGTAETEDSLRALLTTVPWSEGAAERGAAIFKQRGCVLCHGQRGSLGPDLLGATGRFSRDDLFVAIALPDRDVSPRYQTEQIATVDGHVRTGLIVYEAVDGVVLRDANNRTYRIEADEIEIRKTIPKSIMPSGLLKDLQPRDLADLYAFLKGLSSRKEPATQTAGRPSDE